MSAMEWVVVLAGLAAIAWVNWYFFVAGRSTQAAVLTALAPDGRAAFNRPGRMYVL